MAVVRCDKGHYYDDVKFNECPHCKDGLNKIRKETYKDDIEKLKTEALETRELDNEKTMPIQIETEAAANSDKTIGVYSMEMGTELLTGWLVCIKGPARGRDYKVYHGWNRIGRDYSMGICIPEDKSISAHNQAAIVFDNRYTKFYIVNEEGSLTYLNNNHVLESTEIKTGDLIKIGESELIFIAFCTEERKWESE